MMPPPPDVRWSLRAGLSHEANRFGTWLRPDRDNAIQWAMPHLPTSLRHAAWTAYHFGNHVNSVPRQANREPTSSCDANAKVASGMMWVCSSTSSGPL